MKKTKKNYELYLNEIGLSLPDDDYIIGGKMRHGLYGTMLRKYDTIAFNLSFREWKLGY